MILDTLLPIFLLFTILILLLFGWKSQLNRKLKARGSMEVAERALRESESKYRTLFENSPVSLWEEDFSGVKEFIDRLKEQGVEDFRAHFQANPKSLQECLNRIVVLDVNQATLDEYGAEEKKELYENLPRLFEEKSMKTFLDEIVALAEGNLLFVGELVSRTLKGEEIYNHIRLSIAPGHEETWSKVFLSVQNVTERRAMERVIEDDLEKVKEELVLKTRLAAVGKVAGSIAHELRNPLGAIRNACFYLSSKKRSNDPLLEKYLAIIEKEVVVSSSIISNLLDLSRAKEPIKQEMLLRPYLEEAFERVCEAEQIQLECAFEPAEFGIFVDPEMIKQVVSNLLTNSVQALNGGGRITIKGTQSELIDTFTVSNDGPPIPEDLREKVFEPLFTTRASGTGLGLAISRQIIERHGGTIDLIENGAEGATFRIRLPRRSTPCPSTVKGEFRDFVHT